MEAVTRFSVDAAHCQRAEDELYAMLRRQEVAFTARWRSSRNPSFIFKFARAAGIFLSLLGIGLTVGFSVLGSPPWAMPPNLWYLPAYSAALVFFWFVPRIRPALQASLRAWAKGVSERSCRRHAERLIRRARQLAPFDAHYEFKDSLLIYSREKDTRQIVWQRDLSKHRDRGLALRGAAVTVIFRRSSSLYPSVIILQDNSDWLTGVLEATGIATAQVTHDH